MEYLVLLGIVVFLVIVIFGVGVIQEKRELKRYILFLAGKYGQKQEHNEYPSGRFEKIPMFYMHNMPKHFVDDITWNDLNMDEVYKSMNYTESSVGEEYLYYMLRNMDCDLDRLNKQEQLITYFMENEDARLYLQMLYHTIGKTGKYSIFDYLDYVEQVKVNGNTRQILMICLIVASIVVCFFHSGIGIVLLVSLLIGNILSYFKEKKEVEPYLYSLAYVQKLLDACKKLCSVKLDILEESQRELKENLKQFRDFSANSMWIHMGSGNMTGSPLDIMLDYLRMVTHIDLIIFNHLFKKLQGRKEEVASLVKVLGEIEACIAIGWYRNTLPYYTTPDFSGTNLEIKDASHPLIEEAVPNSIAADGGVLITGSNASGKSTFLKTIAINVILAQGVHTVFAKEYKAEVLDVFSSMALRDNVVQGDSYFMVEIKSIKRILEKVKDSERKIICFVDEVLRGTNTVERIAASTHILMCLQKAKTICFAATHDIELARLLKDSYDNYHFEEVIEGDDVKFSYQLCEGKATSRNAIKLLKVLGYDESLVQDAENMATHFLETGEWVVFGKDVLSEG